MAKFMRALLPASLAGFATGAFMYIVANVVDGVNLLQIDPLIFAVLGFTCAAGIYLAEALAWKRK